MLDENSSRFYVLLALILSYSTTFGNDFGEIPLSGIDDNQVLLPKSTRLLQNYLNPFNNSTTLKYNLTLTGFVTITIYNILGQKLAEPVNEYQQAELKSVIWNAGNPSSGIYFARMRRRTIREI